MNMFDKLDTLDVVKNGYWIEKAQRLLESGREHAGRRNWRPLLPRHQYEAMMAIPECKRILRECVDLFYGKNRHQKLKTVKPVTRGTVPDSLGEDKPSKWKYIRDALMSASLVYGKDEIVVHSKRHLIEDLPKLSTLLKNWYQHEYDKMESRKWPSQNSNK